MSKDETNKHWHEPNLKWKKMASGNKIAVGIKYTFGYEPKQSLLLISDDRIRVSFKVKDFLTAESIAELLEL